jgi:predicted nucleic acid-binding protein
MLVLFDTNVLLRIVEPEHAQSEVALAAVDQIEDLGHEPTIVPQVAYEFFAVATRPKSVNGLGLSANSAQSKLEELLFTMRLLRDERQIYERWRDIISNYQVAGKQAHDARLVAAMLRHGISHLVTFNSSDFRRFGEIVAVEPKQAHFVPPAAP